MLIVLEGCDGAGKSTVAEKLSKILDAEVIHCSQYTPNDFAFFWDIIEASKTKNIIADRFCYGQFVYQDEAQRPLRIKGTTVRNVAIGKDLFEADDGESALSQLHRLETKMLDAGTKVIYVTAPVEELQDRLDLRGEYIINGLSIKNILEGYKAIFGYSILPVIEWNTGRDFYE